MAISDTSVMEGLRDARWEGRLELIARDPRVVVDGAHNPAGIATLREALLSDFSYRRLIVVFGALHDKDYAGMLKRILPLADMLVLTRPKEGRAASTGDLLSTLESRYCHHTEIVEDSVEALARARSLAGRDDLICVAGSLYLVGEIKRSEADRASARCETK